MSLKGSKQNCMFYVDSIKPLPGKEYAFLCANINLDIDSKKTEFKALELWTYYVNSPLIIIVDQDLKKISVNGDWIDYTIDHELDLNQKRFLVSVDKGNEIVFIIKLIINKEHKISYLGIYKDETSYFSWNQRKDNVFDTDTQILHFNNFIEGCKKVLNRTKESK